MMLKAEMTSQIKMLPNHWIKKSQINPIMRAAAALTAKTGHVFCKSDTICTGEDTAELSTEFGDKSVVVLLLEAEALIISFVMALVSGTQTERTDVALYV